jgi:hypothetical protein
LNSEAMGPSAAPEGSLNPIWLADYQRSCADTARLFAMAYGCMEAEMGREVALVLSPALLAQVVKAAGQEATAAEQERAHQQLLEAEARQWSAQPVSITAERSSGGERPW